MSKVAEIFESLEYGPAPESAAPVLSWLDEHDRKFKLFINGEWIEPEAGEYFETVNPSNAQPLAQIAQAGAPEVDAAVKAARKALDGWRS
jgi:aldehyde dehydrogenase (NAD+)